MDKTYLLYNILNEYNGSWEYFCETIIELYRTERSLKKIAYKNNRLNIYSLINYLLLCEGDNEYITFMIEDYYKSLKIRQNKCLIISDNHLGRLSNDEDGSSYPLKNEIGLFNAYEHAYKNGIYSIIHLGDLIEGDSCPYQKRLPLEKQIEYFYNYYPASNAARTYLLYGNHDYNAIYWNGLDPQFYKRKSNMELIGVNYSYINFCGNLIKLTHESSQSRHLNNIVLPNPCFELSGHSHSYNVYEEQRIVKVPSLAYTNSLTNEIGYLELTDEEDVFLFKFFNYLGKEVPSKERVLKKGLVLPNPSDLNNL